MDWATLFSTVVSKGADYAIAKEQPDNNTYNVYTPDPASVSDSTKTALYVGGSVVLLGLVVLLVAKG